MAPSFSKLRIFIATLVCVGFCGLTWSQLNASPEKTYRELIFRSSTAENSPVFALSHEPASSCLGQPAREVSLISIFGLNETAISLSPKRLFLEAQNIDPAAKVRGDLSSRIKNRDPPLF